MSAFKYHEGDGYGEYIAILDQNGLFIPPVAIIQKNTLGFTPPLSYISNGVYGIIDPSERFIAGKTVVLANNWYNPANGKGVVANWEDVSSIGIRSFDGGTLNDDVISKFSIVIRIYP